MIFTRVVMGTVGTDKERKMREAMAVSVQGCSPGPVWLLSLASASSPAPQTSQKRGQVSHPREATASTQLPTSLCDVSLAVPRRITLLGIMYPNVSLILPSQGLSVNICVCVSISTPSVFIFKDTLLQPRSQRRSVCVSVSTLTSMFVLKTYHLSNE